MPFPPLHFQASLASWIASEYIISLLAAFLLHNNQNLVVSGNIVYKYYFVSETNISESLCRDGMKTRWRLQWMY